MARRRHTMQMVTGLDIGSTGIRIAVGHVVPDDRLGVDIQIIGTAEVGSSGVQKGSVTSIEEAVSSVSHVLEDVERLIGAPIDRAWIGVSGTQVLCQESRGVVAVAKTDGEISDEDVGRVIDASQTVAAPLNYEVIHVLPRTFTVDGQTGIKDPVGMTGVRLEVDAQIVYGATPHVKNMSKAVYRTGIDIDDLVLGIVATADAVLSPRQKELGVSLVDIGGSTTTLAVYEEGFLVHLSTIPIGSNHITNDLALGLQTSIDVAERIKVSYGECSAKGMTKKDQLQLSEFGAKEQTVPKRFVVEIIAARAQEILERINSELGSIQRHSMLPAGIVLVGGGAKLRGIIDLTKDVTHMNAAYGYPIGIRSATDKINDLAFVSAISLVRWGGTYDMVGPSRAAAGVARGKAMAHKAKQLFRFLIP